MPNQPTKKPIEKKAETSFNLWGAVFTTIKKTQISTWYGMLVIGLAVGVVSAITWSLSYEMHLISEARVEPIYENVSGNLIINYPNEGIDFSSQEIKALPNKIKDKLKEMPKERQVKIKNELSQIKQKINKKGALWQADFTSKSILSDEEKIKLAGVIEEPTETQINDGESSGDSNLDSAQNLPDSFDWRHYHGKNYLTPIKDQGNCGSCWAFAATAALEAGIKAYYNSPSLEVDLSEQDLVSCYHGDGCNGGSISEITGIFSSYAYNTGIALESCYPYAANNAACEKCATWQETAWKNQSYNNLYYVTTENIKKLLIETGPVEVSMVIFSDFLFYRGGIYQHMDDSRMGSHAVTIVGYGSYDGIDYWIVKNSWGEDWGEGGYFRIKIGDSRIAYNYAIAPRFPYPAQGFYQRNCYDNDGDGYCSWGSEDKPGNCPICHETLQDCDDSNENIYENCGAVAQTGSLSITSIPDEAEIYVKDMSSGEYVYRGETPANINLNGGSREYIVKKLGYFDKTGTATIDIGGQALVNETLVRDTQYQDGWPIKTKDILGAYFQPILYDFDNNGKKELIVSGGYPREYFIPNGSLHIFNYDGTYYPNFPIYGNYENVYRGITLYNGTISDINGDGQAEIALSTFTTSSLSNYGGLFVVDKNANLVLEKHYSGDTGCKCNSMGLINNDDKLDIITQFYPSNKVRAIDYSGQTLWEKQASEQMHKNCFNIGDINNDDKNEIIFFTQHFDSSNKPHFIDLYILDSQGNEIYTKNWLNAPDAQVLYVNQDLSNYLLADIDEDSVPELIFTLTEGKQYVGSSIWEYDTKYYIVEYDGSFNIIATDINLHQNKIAAGDINNDNKIEIIFAGKDGSFGSCGYQTTAAIKAITNTGQVLFNKYLNASDVGFPIIADLNSDSLPDICYTASCWGYYISAVDNKGNTIGNPKEVDNISLDNVPAIGDMDNDGDVELVIVDRDSVIYVWDLPGAYNPDTMLWPRQWHDRQNAGLYEKLKHYDILPKVSVDFIPQGYSYPIGTNLYYALTLTNNTDKLQSFYGVFTIYNEEKTEIVYRYVHPKIVYLNPHQVFNTQIIPLFIPNNPDFVGSYYFEVMIGSSYDDIWDEDHYYFEVTGESGGSQQSGEDWEIIM